MFGFLLESSGCILPKIRLFSVLWRIKPLYVISLVFVKKVLTNRDTICYNNQAVSKTGDRNPEARAAGEP